MSSEYYYFVGPYIKCNNSVIDSKETYYGCSKCEISYENNDKFCSKCGTKLKNIYYNINVKKIDWEDVDEVLHKLTYCSFENRKEDSEFDIYYVSLEYDLIKGWGELNDIDEGIYPITKEFRSEKYYRENHKEDIKLLEEFYGMENISYGFDILINWR